MPSKYSFIQVSDLHLGRQFHTMVGFEDTIQKAVKDSFKLVVSLVKRDEVNALFIPGNLFDSPDPPDDLVELTKTLFEDIKPAKVYITPGSSDYYTGDSVYARTDWPDNVHVFKSREFSPVPLEEYNLTIYGFAHQEENQQYNPIVDFTPPADDYTRKIFIFNGSISDIGYPDPHPVAVFRFVDLEKCNCYYAVLGHFHRIQSLKRKGEKSIRGCYSGVPQGITFNDEGEKGVLEVILQDDKKQIHFLPTARVKLKKIVLDCSGMKDAHEVISSLRMRISGEEHKEIATRVILNGGLNTEGKLDLKTIYNELNPEFLYLQMVDNTVSGYDVESIRKEKSVRGAFTETVLEKLNELTAIYAGEPVDDKEREEKEIYELALKYGLDAFNREEVKKRWL